MKPGTDKFLARAAKRLSSAAIALEGGAPDMAAARAYSAMIAAAKALLNEKGLRLIAHAAICAALEKQAAAAGIDERMTALLREGYERRERSARDDLATSFEDAREMVERARELVEAVGKAV
jgi:uncharacterized protein (UPF0332 family)